jgi:hypothetical protein
MTRPAPPRGRSAVATLVALLLSAPPESFSSGESGGADSASGVTSGITALVPIFEDSVWFVRIAALRGVTALERARRPHLARAAPPSSPVLTGHVLSLLPY